MTTAGPDRRDELLAELKATKAEIDSLQERIKDLVAQLRESGMEAAEIGALLRGQ